jgi:hypothetical protein
MLPFFAAVSYLPARMLRRLRQMRVVIGSEGALVVGALRTWRVPLADAVEFVAEVRAGNNPTISLRRRGASSIGLWIFNRNGFVWHMRRLAASLEPRARELNVALQGGRVPDAREADGDRYQQIDRVRVAGFRSGLRAAATTSRPLSREAEADSGSDDTPASERTGH